MVVFGPQGEVGHMYLYSWNSHGVGPLGKEGMAQIEPRPCIYISHMHMYALTNMYTHTQKCPLNTTVSSPRTTHVAIHTQQYHKTVVLSHRPITPIVSKPTNSPLHKCKWASHSRDVATLLLHTAIIHY